jgi:hypothetical protein
MSRISCETAAQCERIAQLQETWMVDIVIWTVLGLVLIVVLLQLYQNRRRQVNE